MDKDQQELKKFLEDQLQWCKDQDHILEEIDSKLHEMKRLAEYALTHELSLVEVEELNAQLNNLKSEVHSLEKQIQSVVH
ncbi:hypothetical protein [Virgibacillus sediminis]|uniref:DUF2524 domain-containing protein n=1 Tax=Virgibacillus sediminis TaxID=202260 RepID=A0ABV7A3S9_9BACI